MIDDISDLHPSPNLSPDDLLGAPQTVTIKSLQDLLGKKNLEIVNLEKANADLSRKTIRNNLSWIRKPFSAN